jgi:ribonuclease I
MADSTPLMTLGEEMRDATVPRPGDRSSARQRRLTARTAALLLLGLVVCGAVALALQYKAARKVEPAPRPPCPPVFEDGPPYGTAGQFDSYVLARFWNATLPWTGPHFDRQILELHGLWPQYNRARGVGVGRVGGGHKWPQYCGATDCTFWAVASPILPAVRKEFTNCTHLPEGGGCWPQLAPAYASGTLASHEWQKHGMCVHPQPGQAAANAATVMRWQRGYFQLQMQLMQAYPTPPLLQQLARNGSSASLAELKASFGGVDSAALALQCNHGVCGAGTDPSGKCNRPSPQHGPTRGFLSMVSMCFGTCGNTTCCGSSGRCQLPSPVACAAGTVVSEPYDDSCASYTEIYTSRLAMEQAESSASTHRRAHTGQYT